MNFKTIKAPYLIQNGKFKDVSIKEVVGLDSLMNYNYMGSAEFEFGALPQSLTRICQNWENYSACPSTIKDFKKDTLWVLCKTDQFPEIFQALKYFSENKYSSGELRTKEMVSLYDYINQEKYCRSDFWWDIDNDWMACFGSDHIEKLIHAINKVCIKKSIAYQKPVK